MGLKIVGGRGGITLMHVGATTNLALVNELNGIQKTMNKASVP
jgi:hypothetical protein